MKVDRYTILHRKDEDGVIVESKIFGPDDKIPDGFEKSTSFQPVQNEVRMATLAESKLTPWESPVAKGSFAVEPQPVDDDENEVNEGTPLQTRDEDDLTDAEKEALAAVEAGADEGDDENEVNDGSPVQAKEEAGVELTESEEKPGEESESAKSGRRRSNRS